MMKKIKLLSISALIAFSSFNAFTQSTTVQDTIMNSLLSYETSSNQTVDVQSFSEIDANSLFSIKASSNLPNLELGAFLRFDDLCFGTNISGNLWGNSLSYNLNLDDLTFENYTDRNIKADFLVGGKKNGLKLGIQVITQNETSEVKSQEGYTQDLTNNFNIAISGDVTWGGTFNLSNTTLVKPIISLQYVNNKVHQFSKQDSNKIDLFMDVFDFTLGSDFVLKKAKSDLLLGFKYFMAFGNMRDTEQRGLSSNANKIIVPLFDPYVNYTYFHKDKVIINSDAHLTIGGAILTLSEGNSNIADLKGNMFLLIPTVGIDIDYAVNPDNFIVNLGASLQVPSVITANVRDSMNRELGKGYITGSVIAALDTGFDLLITDKLAMNLNISVPLSPKLCSTIIDGISLSFSYRK